MKKRILSLVAALALAATVVAPVSAANTVCGKYDSTTLLSYGKNDSSHDKDAVDVIFGNATDVKTGQKDLKPSGAADAKINVVTGDAKDSLVDNGMKPLIKEFVKASREGKVANGEKAGVENLRHAYMFDLTASQTGDVTFKCDADSDAMNGDCYAVVLHYTGNAADEDGVTAQYCKISSAGKVTAHFNSFSPVAIQVTNVESAQRLVNTYSHSAGSDAGTGSAAVATTATPAPTVQPTTDATAVPTTDAAAKAAANGKGAASPKTSDNAYALYLILAVAAVAGTTLVATKKTR